MNNQKLLGSLAVAVAALAALGAGTFATFTAETKNPGNVVAAGTLVLSNTKAGGTACLSTGGGSTDTNVNNSCDTLINLTAQKPGDSGTADVTLKNEGSFAASALKLFSAACTNAAATGATYNGTGLTCGKVQFYVQEYSDAARTIVSACRYGGAVVANTCDFSDTTKTLGAFQTSHNSSSPLSLGSIAAGVSRYFRVGVKVPSDADNTFQGRQASFDLTWHADQ